MSPIGDSDHPADVFDSARRTAIQHDDGGTCFNCTDRKDCKQYAWALDQLRRSPAGLLVLTQLDIPISVDAVIEEGQQR
ncbi:hypothetical protein [Micromonospora aurantiaca (nom. illeg.)]|uniref:hypothetical protein n=1 Tax=Micromonospora aurantiaca (nom. illeg.) TaxID=47850 RepID=UPI0035B4169A